MQVNTDCGRCYAKQLTSVTSFIIHSDQRGKSLSPVTRESVETQIDLLRVFQSGQNHPRPAHAISYITNETEFPQEEQFPAFSMLGFLSFFFFFYCFYFLATRHVGF